MSDETLEDDVARLREAVDKGRYEIERLEIAKAVMQALIAKPGYSVADTGQRQNLARQAFDMAEAMLEEERDR